MMETQLKVRANDQQSKFWPMHHLLFQNYKALSLENIEMMAMNIDLDMEEFRKDVERPEFLERVSSDFTSGLRSGVNVTPSIYINNLRYDGARTYSALKNAIDQTLSKQRFEMYM